MEVFNAYEKKVLNLLLSDRLTEIQIDSILTKSKFVEYDYTGSGYFLTVENEILPNKRIVCDRPFVIGYSDKFRSGFIVFIENKQLMLECHTWGEFNLPEEFRNMEVQIVTEDIPFIES